MGCVSTDAVQFLGNSDNICDNYHHSCAETYLIFMNKVTYLPYKISYKLQNCCHRSYIGKLLKFHQFLSKNHQINICKYGQSYSTHFWVLKKNVNFGPYLGPFGPKPNFSKKIPLPLQMVWIPAFIHIWKCFYGLIDKTLVIIICWYMMYIEL